MIRTVPPQRVCLIGPVAPFRGGVAQHTTMLHRTIGRRSDLLTLSYRRQYPAWLFPGKSDQEPDGEGQSEPEVDYRIDSLNPLTWTAACRRLSEHRPDVVVIPWWTSFWAPWALFTTSYLMRREIPFVFLCHNVFDHEQRGWRNGLVKRLLRRGRRFVTQSSADTEALRRFLPDADIRMHPHPAFDQFPLPPTPASPAPRRAKLELLFFGLVRPYKGLDVLVEAMRRLRHEDVHLTVVGEWWMDDPRLRAKIADPRLNGKIDLVDRYVSKEEAAVHFDRADAVVLPYRSASGSGVIPLAYRYGKPVIASAVGGLPDAVEHGESGWLVTPEDPESLAHMIRFRVPRQLSQAAEGARRLASKLTWDSLVDCLLGKRSHEAQLPARVSGNRFGTDKALIRPAATLSQREKSPKGERTEPSPQPYP